MPALPHESHCDRTGPAQFTTTHWTVILTLRQKQNSPAAAEALENLCRTYWYPLYAYLRRRGLSEHDAQDITQGFLAQLLERGSFHSVSRDRGKFRSFLLASLNYFLADAHDKASAKKRGGCQKVIALDALSAEERYQLEPLDAQDAERLFERRWALTILDEVMRRIRSEFAASGRQNVLSHVEPFLLGEKSHATYAEAAAQLGLTEGAVKMVVLRLRQRFRELFREVIAETVSEPDEVDEELQYLFAVISR
ncbi:MAG: sigma-70 family RNA polymerase sigma factor [Verrucomicrobiota bacterium]